MRRFEKKEGTSSKFWEASVEGKSLTVRFGRIGAEGQEKKKSLASPAAARAAHDKLVAEKLAKGYREIGRAERAEPRAVPMQASKPTTGILGPLLRLFASLTRRDRVEVLWLGRVTFAKGGLAKWRAKKAPGHEETVGEILDRLTADVARGRRYLELRAADDTLDVEGWDWREDWERPDQLLGTLLEAAAPLAPTGGVATYGSFRSGDAKWVTRKLGGKKLLVDEGDGWKEKKANEARTAVSSGLEAWLAKHAGTRARIENSGNAGYVDRAGREVIAPRFAAAFEFSDGLAVVRERSGTYRIIDVEGEAITGKLVSADYFLRGLAPVETREARWGYVDRTGKLKIPATFASATPFRGPLAVVEIRGQHRLITPDGELVGDPIDHYAHDPRQVFSDDRMFTYRNDLQGFGCVDERGRAAIGRRFYNVLPFGEGLAPVVELGQAKWGYVDRAGEVVIAARFDEAHPFAEGRALVRIGKEHRLIDRTGTFVGGPFASDAVCTKTLSEGMIPFAAKGKAGFVDRDGEIAIKARFDEAYGFYEGRAYVQTKDRWGHIDRTGTYVVPPTLEWTNRFKDGVAAVKIDGLCGFIDAGGSIVVEPRYKRIQPLFTHGRAWVELP